MALKPSVVDIQLLPPDQTPPQHSGPSGRIGRLVNAQVVNYVPPNPGVAPVLQVAQRNGFESINQNARSAADGTIVTADWKNPQLLSPLGNQLLSVANHIPRVWNGDTWSYYADKRVVPNKLSERVVHTTQTTMEATDSAVIGGVTCIVWSQYQPSTTSYDTYVGFLAEDGAWIVLPRKLYTGNTSDQNQYPGVAKVVQDGKYFWVVTNHLQADFHLDVRVFSVAGEQLAIKTVVMEWHVFPGYFDLTANTATISSVNYVVQLAQPGAFSSGGGEVNVVIDYFNFDGVSTISQLHAIHGDLTCRGPVAWLRNDTGVNTTSYLATIGPAGVFQVYEMTNNVPTFTYNMTSYGANPDSITGYVDANLKVFAAVSLLSIGYSPPAGPANDPALRQVQIWNHPRIGVATKTKTVNSVIAQSRSFSLGGEESLIAYYQSGTGFLPPASETPVSHHSGDYFLGQAEQPFTVSAGDYETGGPIGVTPYSPHINVTQSTGSITHNAGDSATASTRRWVFNNATFDVSVVYGFLNITGSAHAANNHSFRIVDWIDAHTIVTDQVSTAGTTMVDDTLVGVTATTTPVTVIYWPNATSSVGPPINGPILNPTQVSFLQSGAQITVSGSAVSGNNVTLTIQYTVINTLNIYARSFVSDDFFATGTISVCTFISGNANDGGPGSTINFNFFPNPPYKGFFTATSFDAQDTGNLLRISGASQSPNNGDFSISGVSGNTIFTVGSPVVSEVFGSGVSGAIVLADAGQAYKFHLQNVTFTDKYLGGFITIKGGKAGNDGTYTIKQLIDDHTVITVPSNGFTGQVNDTFTGSETITIQLPTTTQAPIQPCWLLVGFNSSQKIIGQWERGVAYADWRKDGNSTPNIFPMCLSSAPTLGTSYTSVLPYRAQSFTAGQVYPDGINNLQENTVGIKQFFIDAAPGNPVPNFGEMLLPGPLAGQFSTSGFTEDGISLGFEQPFLVAKGVSTAALVLTPNSTYQYVVVAEVTADNGDRIYSLLSPALNVSITGTQNQITIGGRLIVPTNHTLIGISIYRTAIANGIPTTEHYLITDPLDVNGAGFTFSTVGPGPDLDTWQFVDNVPDAAIVSGEKLYTDLGFTQRYPAPAFTQGITFRDRDWVIAYDGSIWVSGEKTEGDALWFSPALRIPPPTDDKPVALAVLDDYIVVCCQHSVRYLAPSTLPDATLRNGALPSLITLPFPNGCTGQAITVRAGVAYGSTAGGVWLITRQLTNHWLSQPLQNDIGTVVAMAVDDRQRLFVADGAAHLFVYDMVSLIWARYDIPSATSLLTNYQGVMSYQDTGFVLRQGTGFADVRGAGLVAIPMQFNLDSISFGTIRNWKRLWALQLVGKYLGPHNLHVELTSPDMYGDPTSTYDFTPSPSKPYVYEFNPLDEEASTWQLLVATNFDGIATPGNSCVIELIGAELGVEGGISRVNATSRVPAK